jgi:dihydrodipicolinate synthase/N-acetylneuraminate lyase
LAETERLYGMTKELTGGRVPAIGMGCEPRHPTEYLPLIRIAESVGLDSMQLYSVDLGHGNKPADDELEHYFRQMLDDMTIPARISSHKAAGYNVPLPVLERLLADYPSIAAIHCITDDLLYLKRVIEIADGRCDVLGGGFHQVLNILAFGGQGFLDSTCALLVPATCRSIIDNFAAGELKAMDAAIEQAVSVAMINRWTGPRTVKAGMRAVDMPGWHLRAPYLPLGPDDQALVEQTLRDAGVAELAQYPALFR